MNKKDKIKQYYINKYINKKKEEIAINLQNRRNISLKFQLWENSISRIKQCLYNKNINYSYKKLLGCNEDELYIYLENKLSNNLKMEDYPKWEIDHIKPISLFDLTNINEQLICFNYTNLQPLLLTLNRQKYNKCEQSELES
jgi:hypothetical protein